MLYGLLVLCVLSGITGLVYETLWIRILSLGVGSTSASMSLVLSLFFFGLSAGSFLAGKFSHRIKRPVFFYGIVELVLAVYSAVAIWPLFNLQGILASIPLTGSFLGLGFVLKYGFVFLILLVPTLCMGTTLPLLTKIFVSSHANVGKRVGHLYALNTLGAVLGAMLTGFYLIPQFGIFVANYVAVGLNLFIAVAAFGIDRKATLGPIAEELKTRPVERNLTSVEKVVLAACGASGFVSLVCEVVWNKYLGIYFGTNIYGLGLTLSVYLLGIAIGSWILSLVIDRVKDRLNLYLILLLLSVIATLFTSFQLNRAPVTSHGLYQLFGGTISLLTAKAFVAAFILLLPTCFFGALFPLSISLLTQSASTASKVVGLAYGVNTVGAILGSYLAGIVFLPHIGSSHTIQLAATVSLVMAGLLIWVRRSEKLSTRLSYAGVTLAVALLTFVTGHFRFESIITAAYHSQGEVKEGVTKGQILSKIFQSPGTRGEEFQMIIEGETAIISLSHDPQDGDNYQQFMRLKTNGLNESVYNLKNLEELPKYEALIGLLPYVFSRDPQNAFIVGYGGGFTVDLLSHTDLKKVNVVELEEGILKAANYVHKGDNPILKRKNVNLQIEDARYTLASGILGPQDIIVSQPSHSWLSGAANLFTKEFFTIVQKNLSDRGIFAQWLNLYNMDVPVLKSLLRTFFTVFPHGAVFTQAGDHELVLLGSNRPLDLNMQKLESFSRNPLFQHKLTSVFQQSAYDLLSMYSISRNDVLELTQDSQLNTDVNAYAEAVQSSIFYEGLGQRQTPQAYLSGVFRGDFQSIVRVAKGSDAHFYYQVLMSMNGSSQNDKLPVVLAKYEEIAKADPSAQANLGYLCLQSRRLASALQYLEKAMKTKPTPEVLGLLLASLTQMERYSEVVTWTKKYPAVRSKIVDCYLGNAQVMSGQWKKAEPLFAKMTADINGYTQACGGYFDRVMGSYFVSSGQGTVAVPFLEKYYKYFPKDAAGVSELVRAYHSIGDKNNEELFIPYLKEVKEQEIRETTEFQGYLEKMGFTQDATVLAGKAARLSSTLIAE